MIVCLTVGAIALGIPRISHDGGIHSEKTYGVGSITPETEEKNTEKNGSGGVYDGTLEVITGEARPGKKDPELYNNTPPSGSFGYSDTDELKEALRTEFSDEKLNEKTSTLDESAREVFKEFTKKRLKENKIYVPSFDGDMFTLKDEAGYPKITLFASEAYNMPWIWYHACVNGTDMIIKTMYTDTNGESASEFLKKFCPDAPNVHNFGKFSNYERIYTKELSVGGKKTEVMVSETKDGERRFYSFMYKEMLVSIQSNHDLEKDDLLSLIAFTEIRLF